MALTLSFAINVICTVPSGSITQPAQAATYTVVAPWGQSVPTYTPIEAFNQVLYGAGSPFSGSMGTYFSAQTLNGATGTGATAFASANTVQSNQ